MRHTVKNPILRAMARAAWRIRRGERVWVVWRVEGWVVL